MAGRFNYSQRKDYLINILNNEDDGYNKALKILYMWVKQNVVSQNQFIELLNNLTETGY